MVQRAGAERGATSDESSSRPPGAGATSVHVVHVSQPTTEGVARCVVDLARAQVTRGLRVTVVCPDDGWLAEEARAAGAHHVSWEAQRSPGPTVVSETRDLRRVLADLRPGLVHLHSAKAGLAGRLAVRGRIPTVFQPHAWSFLAVQGALRRATQVWERWALRWAHRIVCVSEAEAAQALDHGLALGPRVRVVPNGVDTDRFAPRARAASRAELALPETPLAVCVGRLSEQKGQDVLLTAWPLVRERLPTARLVLVGDGPWSERLQERAGEGVVFAGSSQDPRPWYGAADVVVVPSRWEGMALVPLEAASSGRSIVMSDVAGAREAVPAGTGAVVGVGRADELASAVMARLSDVPSADAEGARGREHVLEHFALAVSGARMADLYEELLVDLRPPVRRPQG